MKIYTYTHMYMCTHVYLYTYMCIFTLCLPRKILLYVHMEAGTRMLTLGSFLIVKANREKVK